MNIKERIIELCEARNLKIKHLEEEIGESQSAINTITENSKALKIYKVAKYFGVSMEYLITGENQTTGMVLSREEMNIIQNYRKTSEGNKDAVAKLLDVKRQDTSLESLNKVG
jgi:transcriptional regulator with XRE-family HTH domain